MCFNTCDKKVVNLKKKFNQLLWIHFNDDGNSIIINQEIYATIFPKMEYYQVVDN